MTKVKLYYLEIQTACAKAQRCGGRGGEQTGNRYLAINKERLGGDVVPCGLLCGAIPNPASHKRPLWGDRPQGDKNPALRGCLQCFDDLAEDVAELLIPFLPGDFEKLFRQGQTLLGVVQALRIRQGRGEHETEIKGG